MDSVSRCRMWRMSDSGHRDRHHHRDSHHIGRSLDRTASQDGPRNGVADFDRFRHLRSGGGAGAEATMRTKPYKTAVAVATVVIFGTLLMFLYPVAYRTGILELTPEQMGIYSVRRCMR